MTEVFSSNESLSDALKFEIDEFYLKVLFSG